MRIINLSDMYRVLSELARYNGWAPTAFNGGKPCLRYRSHRYENGWAVTSS